ncbi:MAG: ABC transporter permease [Bacteroidales bacterium]|nr:MAG: ABC transporter permease [Bacteroidales bacterium]
MFKNILKVTINSLLKHKSATLIKILGLSIGLTCCLIISIYAIDEFKYDKFHQKHERIFRLLTVDKRNGEISADQPAVMLQHLINEYPEIKEGTRIFSWGKSSVKYQDKLFLERRIFLADSNIFKIFDFPFIIGDPINALNTPYSLVITESTAKKYFGNKNPVGEVMLFDNNQIFTVKGVIKDVPVNSHLMFDFLGSFSSLSKVDNNILTSWNYSFSYIYLLFNNNSYSQVSEKSEGFLKKYRNERISKIINLKLEQLSSIHLKSYDTKSDIAIKGSIKFIYAFSTIAILILIIACFNFTTLSTAQTRLRAKEIGVRKVVGANQTNIFFQFMFETVMFTAISFSLAVMLSLFILPYLNVYLDKQLSLNFSILAVLFIISLIVIPLFAGFYPAFILSRLKPIFIIKGDFDTQILKSVIGKSNNFSFRNIVVLIQIVFAIVALISTILIYKQLKYIDRINMGFDKENLIVIENPNDDQMQSRYDALHQFGMSSTNIESVSAAYDIPPKGASSYYKLRLEGKSKEEDIQMAAIAVDPGFLNTIKCSFIFGNNFVGNSSTSNSMQVIINESAMRSLNLSNPIGEKIIGLDGANPFVISGVIKNIYYSSLRDKVEPMVFYVQPWANAYIVIKTKTNIVKPTIEELKKNWEQIAPNHIFQYSLMNQNIESVYIQDQKAAFLFSIFTFLTISLSVFGVIGLISFTIESSIKEIVLRKIFGASILNVNLIFYKKLIGVVLISILISSPLSYYIVESWLQEFSYKVNITFVPFLLISGAIIVLIFACISLLIYRGNKLNIIHALKQL